MEKEWVHKLSVILKTDLPGEEAHRNMIPYRALTSEMLLENKVYKESSVAIILFEENGEWKSVLIERPTYPGVHSGQMAFPGGKREESDENLVATALREMHEEIGFYDSGIQFLGTLTHVYIPVSGYLVVPHVFFTQIRPKYFPDATEVAKVVEFNIEHLINDENLIYTTIQASKDVRMKNVPAFSLQDHVVWGATCLMLNELKMCVLKV